MLWRIPADTQAQRIGPCRLYVPPPPSQLAGHRRPWGAVGLFSNGPFACGNCRPAASWPETLDGGRRWL